jgi:hypothetical protein
LHSTDVKRGDLGRGFGAFIVGRRAVELVLPGRIIKRGQQLSGSDPVANINATRQYPASGTKAQGRFIVGMDLTGSFQRGKGLGGANDDVAYLRAGSGLFSCLSPQPVSGKIASASRARGRKCSQEGCAPRRTNDAGSGGGREKFV